MYIHAGKTITFYTGLFEIGYLKGLNDILSRCKTQDRLAQQQLYAYTYSELCIAVAIYAKDNSERDWIFNMGMMRIFTSLEKYRLETNFLGWARTILVRTAIDHLRKNKMHNQHISLIEIEDQQVSSSDFNQMMNEIDTEAILLLLQKLPVKERLIFNMYEMEGYTHREIQEITEINSNTSKWLLSKSKKSLRAMISRSKEIKQYGYEK